MQYHYVLVQALLSSECPQMCPGRVPQLRWWRRRRRGDRGSWSPTAMRAWMTTTGSGTTRARTMKWVTTEPSMDKQVAEGGSC